MPDASATGLRGITALEAIEVKDRKYYYYFLDPLKEADIPKSLLTLVYH